MPQSSGKAKMRAAGSRDTVTAKFLKRTLGRKTGSRNANGERGARVSAERTGVRAARSRTQRDNHRRRTKEREKEVEKNCSTRVYRLVRNTIKSAPQPLKCQRDKGWLSPSRRRCTMRAEPLTLLRVQTPRRCVALAVSERAPGGNESKFPVCPRHCFVSR